MRVTQLTVIMAGADGLEKHVEKRQRVIEYFRGVYFRTYRLFAHDF